VFKGGLIVPSRLVFLMWLIFTVSEFYHLNLSVFGILPREFLGLIGIFTAPLVHGSAVHIISNTIPLLILGGTLYFFYEKIAPKVFFSCYFITNILVWIIGRKNLHIGASGLVYGLAAFLIFYGFFKKDMKSLIISVVILFFYAGMIYGIFPNQPGISWESHLAGAVVGAFTAYHLSNGKRKPAKSTDNY